MTPKHLSPLTFSVLLFAVLLLLGSKLVHADGGGFQAAQVDASSRKLNLGPHLYYLEDTGGDLSFSQVQQLPADRWTAHTGDVFRAGYSYSAFWLVVTLQADAAIPADTPFYFEIDTPFMGLVDFYLVKRDGITTHHAGLMRPYSQRPTPSEVLLLPLQMEPGEVQTLYLRIESEGSILVPTMLYDPQTFLFEHARRNLLMGCFFSLCLVLAIYNFFLFVSIRDSSYLLYTLNSFAIGWFQASGYGYTVHYVWQDNFPRFSYLEPHLTVWIAFITALLFSRSFLKLSELHPRFNKLFIGLISFCVLMAILALYVPHRPLWTIFNAASPVFILSMLSAAVYSLIKGNRAARFFLLGWGFFLFTALLATLYYQGLIEDNFFTKYGLLLGSAVEGLLLSLALADRINIIQRERVTAQKQAVAALEHSHRVKDEFLLTVGHELRTPLNGILGALELNRRESDENKREENNHLILASATRMTESVSGLLCLSEINADLVKVQDYVFQPHQKWANLLESAAQQCEEKGLHFELNYLLPTERHYRGDPEKIYNILSQLLKNAVTYTKSGSVSVLIGEEIKNGEDALLRIVVEDTGQGIAPDKRQRIFEAFQQTYSGLSRSNEGLGIGLYICKRLSDLLGGHISLASNVGKGSRFEVTLPLRCAPSPTSMAIRRAEAGYTPQVLLVEDNIVNQRVLEKILSKLQCKVSVANNGLEALQHVEKQRPDLIFMDCQMPVMDGLEATRRLREKFSKEELPIVAVTANALSSDRMRCLNVGMNDYLMKPVKMDDFRGALQRWLPLHIP